MKTQFTAAFLFLSVLNGTMAGAQTATPPLPPAAFVDQVNGMSLEQAVARAIAEEPSMRAARTTVDVARGMARQAQARVNPSVSMERRDEPGGTDNQTMVTVQWPLDLFRRKGRVAVAEREVTAVGYAVADRERLLAAEVRARYGNVLSAVRVLASLDDLVGATRTQYELLRARAEQGASPSLERDLADVELRRLNAERVLQVGRAEQAMFELKQILGAAPDEPLRVRDTLDDIVAREGQVAPDAPTAGQRPDVQEAEARIQIAAAKADRAEREGRLDVSLFGGFTRMDAGFPQLGLSPPGMPERVHGVFNYVAGGVMLTVPLFNRNQGEVAAAKAERLGASALHDAARLSARTELAIAKSLDLRAHEAVRLFGGSARPLAVQNLSVVRQSHELGRTTIFEVLSEQKRYLELERSYIDTLRAAYDARTALQRASGESR